MTQPQQHCPKCNVNMAISGFTGNYFCPYHGEPPRPHTSTPQKCDKCGKEVGNLFCGHCRAEIQRRHSLVPLLYYDKISKGYRAGCSCIECPNNENRICIAVNMNIDQITFHEYDGDKCIKQVCG